MDRSTCACFTGHRDIPPEDYEKISSALMQVIDRLYREKVTTYFCGGALGFDTVAAVTLLNGRRCYPELRLILALPCPEQSEKWSEASRALYRRILASADEVRTLSPFYTRGCMLERNRYMVENSAVCVAYLRRRQGGSAFTVDYARKKGLRIFNLADYV